MPWGVGAQCFDTPEATGAAFAASIAPFSWSVPMASATGGACVYTQYSVGVFGTPTVAADGRVQGKYIASVVQTAGGANCPVLSTVYPTFTLSNKCGYMTMDDSIALSWMVAGVWVAAWGIAVVLRKAVGR